VSGDFVVACPGQPVRGSFAIGGGSGSGAVPCALTVSPPFGQLAPLCAATVDPATVREPIFIEDVDAEQSAGVLGPDDIAVE